MKKLSEKKKALLRAFVDYTCEECHQDERTMGKLTIHRINRGYLGGEYVLRNIKVICNGCSKKYHYKEFNKK